MTVSFMLCVFYNKKVIGTLCSFTTKRRYGNLFGGVQHQCTGLNMWPTLPSPCHFIQGYFSPINLRLQNHRHSTVTSVSDFPLQGVGAPISPPTAVFKGQLYLTSYQENSSPPPPSSLSLLQLVSLCIQMCSKARPRKLAIWRLFLQAIRLAQKRGGEERVGNRIAVMRCCFFQIFSGRCGLVLFHHGDFNQELHFICYLPGQQYQLKRWLL